MNFINYNGKPQDIIKFLNKCNYHVQWDAISNDLDNDDINKLIQDGYLIKEIDSYVRYGFKLRDYHQQFCKLTDRLQALLEFKRHITKLNISGVEWQNFMVKVTARYKDKEEFDLDYSETCQLTYYLSNLCSIIHSIRYFLQKHILCKVCKIKLVPTSPNHADFDSNTDLIIFKNCVYYKDTKTNNIKQSHELDFKGKPTESNIKAYLNSMNEHDKNQFTSIGMYVNFNSDKLIAKYSKFQEDYDRLNSHITNNHLYSVCSNIRNSIAHGGDIQCFILRKKYLNQFYYMAMCDYHKLKSNSKQNTADKKALDKYYYNERLLFIDAILQGYIDYISPNQIDKINCSIQLALNDKNINVRSLSKNELEKLRNDDKIKLYHHSNSLKNSLMSSDHWFNLSDCFNDIYKAYIELYTQLYKFMLNCDQNLIKEYYLIGDLLQKELCILGGKVNIPEFDLKLLEL